MTLILASQSPRRKELLSLCGWPFVVKVADVDETLNPSLSLEDAMKDLSKRKAAAIFHQFPFEVVIGADTIVTLDQEVLGKPQDPEDAKKMLRQLSGRTHQVLTGVTILAPHFEATTCSTTQVTMKTLTEEEIEAYVATKEPLDKAGAYGIQGKAACFITKLEGDYYSVMGLPVYWVYATLQGFLSQYPSAF